MPEILLEILKIIGAFLGVVAFVWKVWDLFSKLLYINLVVDHKEDGSLSALTVVENKSAFDTSYKTIGFMLLSVGLLITGCASDQQLVKEGLVRENKEALDIQEIKKLADYSQEFINSLEPEHVDYLLALKDRGLYLNNLNQITQLDTSTCQIETVGHRGFYNQPENSLTAIQHGLVAGSDSIEIDIMRLRDGNWVVHHDPTTGRATGRLDGKIQIVSEMDSREWNAILIRDPTNSKLIRHEPAPYLTEALNLVKRFANAKQKVNLEIKGTYPVSALEFLDKYVNRTMGNQYYYSSTSFGALVALRSINPQIYLGFIQKAHRSSINLLINRSAADRKINPRFGYIVETAKRSVEQFYAGYDDDWTSASKLDLLKSKLGPNTGLHLDIRRYNEVADVLLRAHERRIKIQTYSITSTKYHQDTLLKLAEVERLPDGVIIDTSPYQICQRLYANSIPAGRYQPQYLTGKMVSILPVDADMQRMEEQRAYVGERFYLRLDGSIGDIFVFHESSQVTDTTKQDMALPAKLPDEELKLENSAPFLIELKPRTP